MRLGSIAFIFIKVTAPLSGLRRVRFDAVRNRLA